MICTVFRSVSYSSEPKNKRVSRTNEFENETRNRESSNVGYFR